MGLMFVVTAMPKNKEPQKLEVDVAPIDRFAIWITDTLGTLWFLYAVLLILLVYLLWNCGVLGLKPFDRYPFDGLDTGLSIFAVILSTTVLISQNRQRRLEKIREQVEFKINVQAEHEVTKMLEMLHDIQRKLGINKKDPELEKMKEITDLNALHQQADEEQQT
jgi:uncharacterized membrane protein